MYYGQNNVVAKISVIQIHQYREERIEKPRKSDNDAYEPGFNSRTQADGKWVYVRSIPTGQYKYVASMGSVAPDLRPGPNGGYTANVQEGEWHYGPESDTPRAAVLSLMESLLQASIAMKS